LYGGDRSLLIQLFALLLLEHLPTQQFGSLLFLNFTELCCLRLLAGCGAPWRDLIVESQKLS
jgi:hypothetical protein